MASAQSSDDNMETLKSVTVKLEKHFTLIQHIDKITKEKERNADKLANDFLPRINVLSANERNKYVTRIQRLFDEAKECSDDKVKLADLAYDEINEIIKRLDLDKERLEEKMYNRASGAKNIEEGVQQIDGIWNTSSRKVQKPPYKINENKKIQKGIVTNYITNSNEEIYCFCKQISYGKMIACDNSCCPIEWFHFGCVNVTTKPKGKWFCPKCRRNKKKK